MRCPESKKAPYEDWLAMPPVTYYPTKYKTKEKNRKIRGRGKEQNLRCCTVDSTPTSRVT